VIVRKNYDEFRLFVIGGKSSTTGPSAWLNTVESLDLTYFLRPYEKKGDDKEKGFAELTSWEPRAPLKHARSNFAAVSIKDGMYVFGGISGVEDGFKPKLAVDVVERYHVAADQWETIVIQNAP